MAYLHETARAKIPDNLILTHKMLILCLLQSRHSQIFKTIFHIEISSTGCKDN